MTARWIIGALWFTIFFGGGALASPSDRVIVEVAPDTDPAEVAKAYGVIPDYIYAHALRGFAGKVSGKRLGALAVDPRVVSTEADRNIQLEPVIVETEGAEKKGFPLGNWGLDRINQRNLPLDGFYAPRSSGRGITAYILDTGIRYSHQEFEGRATFGYDAHGGDGSDCDGHGTHVAGIVGGKTFGVAKKVKLVSVAIYSCAYGASTAAMISGIDWVAGHHQSPAVANISIITSASQTLDRAVRNMILSGVPIAVAAGNNSSDACAFSPGRVSEAMTVGGIDQMDRLVPMFNSGPCLDWVAPGAMIRSASVSGPAASVVMSGTSMAAPHAAGAAALYLEQHPLASAEEVRSALYLATTKNIARGYPSSNGYFPLLYIAEEPSKLGFMILE